MGFAQSAQLIETSYAMFTKWMGFSGGGFALPLAKAAFETAEFVVWAQE